MPPASGETAGVVLAGGQSRRMRGGHKFLMELGGETLIARTIRRLAPQVGVTAISANCDPALIPELDLPVLPDKPPSRGPLSGIHAGLVWAQAEGCSHVATAASDTPFFPPGLVARLSSAASSSETIVLAASGGRLHPVFGLWPVSIAPALEAFLDEAFSYRIGEFVQRCGFISLEFPIENGLDPFFNVNTPDDLAEARRRIGGDR